MSDERANAGASEKSRSGVARLSHPRVVRLVLVEPRAVHGSHAALSLTRAEPNLLRPEGLTRAQSGLARTDRGTGAEADPTVAKSGTSPEGDLTVGRCPAIRHPRGRPPRSDIGHARRHGLGVGHS